MTIKLAITSDHGGYALKEYLKSNFKALPVEWVDLGPDSENSVDYPDFGKKLADLVELPPGMDQAMADPHLDRMSRIAGQGVGHLNRWP